MSSTILFDNGSLEPAATLALRRLAESLGRHLGTGIEAVSLLHSSGIAAHRLGGVPAEILFPALERRFVAGQNDFTLLPLFFGPSLALTVYLPEQLARLRTKHPALRVRLAPPLHAAGDERLAQILEERVRAVLSPRGTDRVALVDHGSPVAAVTAVRNELARQLAVRLGKSVAGVAACSMERRPEPEYDFNDPLLSALLEKPEWHSGRVIVALQFLQPGRHAGPDGDVMSICRAAAQAHPGLEPVPTGLVGDHPLVLAILADRLNAATAI